MLDIEARTHHIIPHLYQQHPATPYLLGRYSAVCRTHLELPLRLPPPLNKDLPPYPSYTREKIDSDPPTKDDKGIGDDDQP